MKSTVHFKKNSLVLVLLLIAYLMLLTSCGAQNGGSGSPSPYPKETQVSSPSTSVLPTQAPTSPSSTNSPSSTSPPSICSINPPSLTFDRIGLSDSLVKKVTITNCGGSGEWSAYAHTDDGANWLVLSPSVGKLDGGTSGQVSIAVISTNTPPNKSNGTVTFTLGQSQTTVAVDLSDSSPGGCGPCLTRNNFSFVAIEGQGNQQSQPLGISAGLSHNDTNANWSASVSTDDGASWLSISPSSGQLNNGLASASIVVNSTGLGAGLYQGTITITGLSSSLSAQVVLVVQPSTTIAPPQATPT